MNTTCSKYANTGKFYLELNATTYDVNIKPED